MYCATEKLSYNPIKYQFKFDKHGRLIETNQGVQVRKFKYDSLGRLTRQKLAEQTATINDAGVYVGAGNPGAVWSEAFVYDNRSNLVQKTDARNVKSNYTYTEPDTSEDALNRIQKISYDASGATNVLPAPDVTYSYMTTGDKARISQVRTNGILTEGFSYDGEGRLYESTETVDGRAAMAMTYLYDSLDRTKEVRYPAQYGISGSPRKIVVPTYDVASRLSSLKVNGVVQADDIVYNSSDQTESIKIGVTGTNQVTEKYTYNSLSGLLTNQKAIRNYQTANEQSLLDLSYDYAKNNSVGTGTGKTGHLTKTIDNLNSNKNKEYEFDALGRLTKAKGGNNLWTQTYSYDRFGNRLNVVATGNGIDGQPMQKDGIGDLNFGATPNSSLTNRITTSGWEYDVAGNLTRGLDQNGVWLKYEYDAANRLQVIKKDSDNSYVQAFQFGSTNQRVMDMDYGYGYLKIFAHGGAVEYTEFAGNVLSWTKTYVYLGDSILSMITPSGNDSENTEFNHPDRFGTRLTTNQQSGANTEQNSLPFGTALASETSLNNNTKKFTSYERSARTGLDYAINRTYDSKLGRFTQVDPIGMKAVRLNAPQTLNLYSYCGNDPINHTDPNGLFWGSLFKWFNKYFKWIAIAVTVAFIVLSIAASHGTLSPFLTKILGILTKILGVKVTSTPLIITNLSGQYIGWTLVQSISIGLSGQIIAAANAVGAIANSFASKPKKKKETPVERRNRLIKSSIDSAFWRLINRPECKTFIQEEFKADPVITLAKTNVVYNSTIKVAENADVGKPDGGEIRLGDKWFDDLTIDGWTGVLSRTKTRTLVLLHGLKHVNGTDHDRLPDGTYRDSAYFYKGIANNCFGLNIK